MKTIILPLILLCYAQTSCAEESSHSQPRSQDGTTAEESLEELVVNDEALSDESASMVVITGARFVSIEEFLGQPNLNELPPTSAGAAER